MESREPLSAPLRVLSWMTKAAPPTPIHQGLPIMHVRSWTLAISRNAYENPMR